MNHLLSRGRQKILLAIFLLGLATTAYAQVDTGSIVGQVTDATGAAIPNATVTVREENTGIKTTVHTGGDGNYTISPLKIGNYTLTVVQDGFTTSERQHIDVSIQSRLEVNMALQVGGTSQVVQVDSSTPILETQSSSIQQLVEARAINDLPLNGRNAAFLAQLSPGVTFAQNDNRGLQASGSFVANGMRRTQNNYLLDGMDNNVAIGDLVNQSQYVVMPPPDALREFTVQTSNYSAEFGHSAGAVLNVSTKSGANAFHGNVWWFVRNDLFDARDWFAKTYDTNGVFQSKPKFRLNQFGGTFGGPIWRDHTFFFVDYQGTRIVQGKTFNVTVPTAFERDPNNNFLNLSDLITQQTGSAAKSDALGRVFPVGTVFDPATTRQLPTCTPVATCSVTDPVTGLSRVGASGQYVRDPFYNGSVVGKTSYTDAGSIAGLNQLPQNRVSTVAQKLLSLYPAPNTNGAALLRNYTSSPNNISNTDQFDTRLDHTFSSKDSVFFRYSFSYNSQQNPGPFPGLADGAAARPGSGYTEAQNGALSWTHILTSHLVNEARVGYSRVFDKRLQQSANDLSDIPSKYGIPGVPQVTQNGGLPLFEFGQLNNLGQAGTLPSDKASNVWQATENVSMDRSKHQMRAGFEFQNVAFPMVTPTQPRGDFTHSGIYTSIVNSTDSSTDRAQFLVIPIANSNTNPALTTAQKPNYVGGANALQATNFPATTYPVRRYYGAYFQDSWRATQTFTLNFGLRYEFLGQPAEKNGSLANFQSAYTGDTKDGISRYYVPVDRLADVTQNTSVVNTLQANGVVITPVNDHSIGFAQKTNFAPRTGFAFQPTAKMSVRGGYGMFFGPTEIHGLSISPWVNFPFQVNNSYSGGSATSSVATSTNNAIGPIDQGLKNVSFDPKTVSGTALAFQGEPRYPKSTYSQAYSLQVQYQIVPSTIFFVGYVGSNSRHVALSYGTNTVNTISAPNVNVNTVSFFHASGSVMSTGGTYLSRNGASNYNSLQFGAERRMRNGLAFTANMTYSRCMGNVRDLLDNGVGGLRAPYVPGYGPNADYARCDTDVKRVIHTSGTYELPFGKNKHYLQSGVGRWVAGGWSLNWISTIQDGQPQSIACPNTVAVGLGCFATKVPGADPYTHGDSLVRTAHFYNNSAFTIQPAVVGTTTATNALGGPPAQITGPQFRKLDISLFRRFDFIHETYFQFRGEVFNVTNTPNFAQPGTLGLNNATSFGQISGTRDNPNDPREVQFSLKYYF